MASLVLASSSQYRKMLLANIGIQVDTHAPDIDETPFANESPTALSLRLAEQKARERKEREEAEKAEAARKAKEAKERAEMERIMQEQLAKEQAAMRQQRRQQVLSEVERYQIMIQQTIMRYLNADFKDKSCRLKLKLATTGFVSQVSIVDGDAALCRAAESAVRRAETLPMSEDPAVYEELKDIDLKVEL